MLHYMSTWYIGDVHPHYDGDTLYLYYLKPNGIIRCDAVFSDPAKVVCTYGLLARTQDYLNWQEGTPGQAVLNLVKVDDTYYFCRGTGERSFYESKNLVDWQVSERYRFILDTDLFPAGARDYACFWDHDLQGIRVTMNAYFTNEHKNIGQGLMCCVGISEPLLPGNHGQPAQRVLLPLDDSGKDLWHSMEPECNQMISIGNRWYLITSLARQTIHWVGPPSYWIGHENTPVDQQDWSVKTEHRLDGEDLCAAQVAVHDGKYYIFGWIPMNYNGQEWGGHLNFPHEVYPIEGGFLATRLDQAFALSIAGQKVRHPLDSEPLEPYGFLTRVAGRHTNFGLKASYDLSHAGLAGLIAEAANGITILLDRSSATMRVVQIMDKEITFEYSSIHIDGGEWHDQASLHLIFDEDIIEVFFNDRYSLCARVHVSHMNAGCGAFCSSKDGIRRVETYPLQRPG